MHLDETPLFAPLKGLDAGSEAILDDSELAHLKVFRLEAGDTLELVDGNDEVAYSTVITSDTLVLPSTLSGGYQLRLIPNDGSYIYFYGYVLF